MRFSITTEIGTIAIRNRWITGTPDTGIIDIVYFQQEMPGKSCMQWIARERVETAVWLLRLKG
jgi:hypothetical protein